MLDPNLASRQRLTYSSAKSIARLLTADYSKLAAY
jgi:hypothetical protein